MIPPDPIGVLEVIRRTCEEQGFSTDEVLGPTRHRILFNVRALCAARLRARNLSYPHIARYMKRKSHASVMHWLGLCHWKPARKTWTP